jgi:hypothetical protein
MTKLADRTKGGADQFREHDFTLFACQVAVPRSLVGDSKCASFW